MVGRKSIFPQFYLNFSSIFSQFLYKSPHCFHHKYHPALPISNNTTNNHCRGDNKVNPTSVKKITISFQSSSNSIKQEIVELHDFNRSVDCYSKPDDTCTEAVKCELCHCDSFDCIKQEAVIPESEQAG